MWRNTCLRSRCIQNEAVGDQAGTVMRPVRAGVDHSDGLAEAPRAVNPPSGFAAQIGSADDFSLWKFASRTKLSLEY